MAKQTIADKMAEKTFLSDGFQRQWQIHLHAFRPILETAFVEKYQALVHLTAALNLISSRKVKEGLDKLMLVEKHIDGQADLAAWLFCNGLAYEMGGNKEGMITYYMAANRCGHRFYLPYLKVAKAAYADGAFDVAELQFRGAAECFAGMDVSDNPQNQAILASAYSNLASTLIQMHRYAEAEEAIEQSKQVMAVYPGRAGTEAVLYAAQGDRDRAEEALARLNREQPMLWEPTKETVEDILSGRHPDFPPNMER